VSFRSPTVKLRGAATSKANLLHRSDRAVKMPPAPSDTRDRYWRGDTRGYSAEMPALMRRGSCAQALGPAPPLDTSFCPFDAQGRVAAGPPTAICVPCRALRAIHKVEGCGKRLGRNLCGRPVRLRLASPRKTLDPG